MPGPGPNPIRPGRGPGPWAKRLAAAVKPIKTALRIPNASHLKPKSLLLSVIPPEARRVPEVKEVKESAPRQHCVNDGGQVPGNDRGEPIVEKHDHAWPPERQRG